MDSLGRTISKEDIRRLCSIQKEGKFTIRDFLKFLTTEEIHCEELHMIFQEFDKNGTCCRFST